MRVGIGITLILALFLSSSGRADSDRSCAIYFTSAKAQFRELELPEEIHDRLADHPSMRITPPDRCDSVVCECPLFNSDCYQPELMTEMAGTLGVRYIVWLKVKEAGIRQSDRTLIPYVFRWHRRCFALAVQMFMFDSVRRETVLSECFESKRSGPSAMSYLDFDPNNPSLIKRYSAVKGKFTEMEAELSEKIARTIVEATRGR